MKNIELPYKLKRIIVISHDSIMIALSWFLAYWIGINLNQIPQPMLIKAEHFFPFVFIIQNACFFYFGLYRGMWRFASIPDLIRIIKSILFATILITLVLYIIGSHAVMRSTLPLYSLLLLFGLAGSRIAYRHLKEQQHRGRRTEKRALIVGAGHEGEKIVRSLLKERTYKYYPVAIIDDDDNHKGREIHGIRVITDFGDIPNIIHQFKIDVIIIASPSLKSSKIRELVDLSKQFNIFCFTIPSLNDIANGKVSINELRRVSLNDLLGRDQVDIDWDTIGKNISAKRIVVTGAGGSIGSELCRIVAKLQPECIILIENNEYNLYAIEHELRRKYPLLKIINYLEDVTDRAAIKHIFHSTKPDLIFHSAAYKHVPMLEDQPRKAITNNVCGTINVAMEADACHVKKFILISTDKAVNPTNIMGASKRIAEIFCQNYNLISKTEFVTVRFGNVLGSRGSVVPLFYKQLKAGGPLTVTHPDITRYFMTIPEACKLILQASVMGSGGEIYVLDMGAPIKIKYIAEQIILLSGKKLGEDIDIVYTGLRAGEKLYEELFLDSEDLSTTDNPKIMKAKFRKMDWHQFTQSLNKLITASKYIKIDEMYQIIQSLVPEAHIKFTIRQQEPEEVQ